MTPDQRIHELIMCPLQRCYPADKPSPPRQLWNGAGRWLSATERSQLTVLDAAGRDHLIENIVADMRLRVMMAEQRMAGLAGARC